MEPNPVETNTPVNLRNRRQVAEMLAVSERTVRKACHGRRVRRAALHWPCRPMAQGRRVRLCRRLSQAPTQQSSEERTE